MIIYGWRSTKLAAEPVAGSCPNCKRPNTLHMHVFQKYAHVFWIPFFPLNKYGASQCGNCQQVLKSKQMPEDVKLAYEDVKAQTKLPYWTFAGLAIVVFFIVLEMVRR